VAKRKKKEETSRPARGSAAEQGESSVYRKYPAGLRQEALQRMDSGGNLSELARELGSIGTCSIGAGGKPRRRSEKRRGMRRRSGCGNWKAASPA